MYQKRVFLLLLFTITLAITPTYGQSGEWTWIHGDNTTNQNAVLGIVGVPDPANKPSATYEACEFTDKLGNFWLFGGARAFATDKNDIWKYDADPASATYNQWTRIRADIGSWNPGVYGIQGVPDPANTPGARGWGTISWVDTTGNFWIFGGSGFDENADKGKLGDLWRYDPNPASPTYNQWTWMKGSKIRNTIGFYGTKGIADPANNPHARDEVSASWTDDDNNLWFFGGSTSVGHMNDLWKYDIAANEWTWMSGDSILNGVNVYGIRGVADPLNVPGSRQCYATWKDLEGKFWMFGGIGFNAALGYTVGYDDIWKYDPEPSSSTYNQWIWMDGSDSIYMPPVYGDQCNGDTTTTPGFRMENRARWVDFCGNFWVFAGNSLGGFRNDLWKYDPIAGIWTWVSGDSIAFPPAVYGSITVSDPLNRPGFRSGSASWKDKQENLWTFGGLFGASHGNDLWRFSPDSGCSSPVTAGITPDTEMCVGDTVAITATGGYEFQWISSLSLSNDSTASVLAYPDTTTTYYVNVSRGACSALDSITVTVNDLPEVILGSAAFCTSDSVNLDAGTDGISYFWSNGETNSTIMVDSAGIYHVEVTDDNGCKSRDTAIVIENSLPQFALDSPSFCVGSSDSLTVTLSGLQYLWSTTDTTQSILVTGSGIYAVKVTDSNNCSFTDSTLVVVFNNPSVSLTDQSFCEGDSSLLDAGGPFASYVWDPVASGSQTLTVFNTGTYSVLVSDTNNCVDSASAIITVLQNPVLLLDSPVICVDSISVISGNSGPGNYAWYPDGQTTGSITVDGGGSYCLVFTDLNSCKDSVCTIVTVNSLPVANVIPGDTSINEGEILQLHATGGLTYQWYPDYGLSNSSIANPIFDHQDYLTSNGGIGDLPITIYTEITDANGCKNIDSILIFVEFPDVSIYIPNAFSPNSDGLNDEFKIKGINFDDFHLTIFNRWGEIVFESADINKSWIGRTANSKPVQQDTYVYRLELEIVNEQLSEDNKKVFVGNVTVVR